LFYTQGRHEPTAAATVKIDRTTLLRIVIQETTFVDELEAGRATIEGDAASLLTIFGNLESFPGSFAIVEP
jgi:alkyl sulfatase BDS1-like metallo-beta-lactamase superfamily hydrolase